LIYPNPGKTKITFAFQSQNAEDAKVEIYNISGERVVVLNNRVNTEGVASVVWDCSAIAPGVYVARVVQAGKEIGKNKIAVVR